MNFKHLLKGKEESYMLGYTEGFKDGINRMADNAIKIIKQRKKQ